MAVVVVVVAAAPYVFLRCRSRDWTSKYAGLEVVEGGTEYDIQPVFPFEKYGEISACLRTGKVTRVNDRVGCNGSRMQPVQVGNGELETLGTWIAYHKPKLILVFFWAESPGLYTDIEVRNLGSPRGVVLKHGMREQAALSPTYLETKHDRKI